MAISDSPPTIESLLDACREIMNDYTILARYKETGLSAEDVLKEIRRKHPEAFPLVSWLDVHDEMVKFYGKGRP